MKKILLTIGSLLTLFGIVGSVLYFLPNELSFKIYNAKGISATDDVQAIKFFQKAGESFPQWQLISENNEMGKMYEQKKHKELEKKLSEKLTNECDTKQEKISEFCENIFYLDGLVQYKLGENLQDKEQKEYFQKAINSFQKALAINNENTWAKENIDFILQKSKQQNQQQKKGDKQGKQKNQSKSKQGKGDKQGEEKNQQGENGEQGKEQKNQSKSQQGEGEKQADKEGQNGTQGENGENNAKSRLPQKMQQALEKAQKEMDQDQSQKGFNRSRSAAQKNNYKNQDPMEQMMQQFFGGTVGAQMGEKNLSQEIQDPNEKDW